MLKRLLLLLIIGLAACRPATLPAPLPEPPTATIAPIAGSADRARVAAATAPSATPLPQPSATPPPTDPPPPTATAAPTETPAPQPTPDGAAAARRVRLPILMYHYVEPWPANADEFRRGLTVRPEDFAAQMQYLADRGYVSVSLYDLSESLALGKPLPERAVVLTFDDGYRSLMDYALPVMTVHGFAGTVFAITEFMDRGLPQYLTWDQARALYAQGWRIEPHTKTHTVLAGESWDKQLYEILGAVETIQANLGARPRFLCYPSGKYDRTSIRLAQEIQLWGAVTTHGGRIHNFNDRYLWTRERVDGRGTLKDFVNALEGDLK